MPRNWLESSGRGKLAQAGPLLALFLFGWLVYSFDEKDTPLKNTDQGSTRSENIQGVAGKITNSAGNPIAGAMVLPKCLDDEGPPIPEILVTSDSDGRYSWRLFPGRYQLSVSAAGYRGAVKQATVKPKARTVLDFTLEPAQ